MSAGDDYNQDGYRLLKKAEDSLKPGFFGRVFGSRDEQFDKALDRYKSALDNFKLAKNCELIRD